MPDQANYENTPQNYEPGSVDDLDAWLAEHPNHVEHARMSPSQQKYFVAPEQLAQWQAARRVIEDRADAQVRPRSDEAADLRVGSGLHDRYLLLKGEPIGAIWKAGWAERLVDAVRQMELDPPEDWEATPEMEAALASDLMDIPINEAHFAASEDPYGEIAAVLLGKGWRR